MTTYKIAFSFMGSIVYMTIDHDERRSEFTPSEVGEALAEKLDMNFLYHEEVEREPTKYPYP